jgi:hypothetical protein
MSINLPAKMTSIRHQHRYDAIAKEDRRAIEAGVLKNGFNAYLSAITPHNPWAHGARFSRRILLCLG